MVYTRLKVELEIKQLNTKGAAYCKIWLKLFHETKVFSLMFSFATGL